MRMLVWPWDDVYRPGRCDRRPTAVTLEGLVSAEEFAAREATAVTRAEAAMPGDVTVSGVTTSSAGWYGAHLTLGRRP
jgi:hypothetical protein